jgi:pyridoxine kinase
MTHILALSSWVAHGHVGLSAAAPVLQAFGHRVTQLPTVQLSNHAGFPHVAGRATDVETLAGMCDALDRNGWLDDVDAVLTGYMPGADHVAFAARLIDRLAATGPRVIVDPVLGDHPRGLYIAPEAAEAIRDTLLPRADVLTPNLFELSWLAGRAVDTLRAAQEAARDIASGTAEVLVTSPPLGPAETGVLSVTRDAAMLWRTDRLTEAAAVPHGVGDVFSALIAADLSVGAALGHLRALIGQSLHAPHLAIAEAAPIWRAAEPIHADASALLTGQAPLTGTSETR